MLITISVRTTGIILSGSPYSVYDAGSPHVDPAVFDLGVPILGICYGLQVRPTDVPQAVSDLIVAQELAWNLGGEVSKCDHREYGPANIIVDKIGNPAIDSLFEGFGDELPVRVQPPSRSFDKICLPWSIRYGCPMGINCPNPHRTSILSAILNRHPMQRWLTSPNLSMVYSSIRK